MPARRLPATPNLEHLKKQAKQLVKDHKSGQVEAFARIKAFYPRLADASVREILDAEFTLCHAQLVIAREHGIPTWQKLVEAVTAFEPTAQDAGLTDNPALNWIRDQIAQAASTDLPILITGEPGTGKRLVARTIHHQSDRKTGPFIQVACSVTPELLAESDLFGHEQGAFTGARSNKPGKVETAGGGTLFLDEIGALSASAQTRLLRLLEDGQFERIGGTEPLRANARIIAATDQDLPQKAIAGAFHRDLSALLQTLRIHLPALRERREDIPLLAAHFATQMAAHLNREVPQLSPEAQEALQAHAWPGNIRELENKVQRAVAVCRGAVIQRTDIEL